MIPRVVELSSAGQFAHVSGGFLTVSKEGAEVGRVPMDDIGVLLCSSPQTSVSTTLLSRLADSGGIKVICGENYRPAGILWPTNGNLLHKRRLARQIEANHSISRPGSKSYLRRSVINFRFYSSFAFRSVHSPSIQARSALGIVKIAKRWQLVTIGKCSSSQTSVGTLMELGLMLFSITDTLC